MNCPSCKDVALVMTERQRIEIDYCPQCRGVWLDRGELDKIIERTEQVSAPARTEPAAVYRDGKHHGTSDSHGHHRKKSLWSELFD
jgi:Zn-finger nucleic acid-binding protein